MNTQTETPKRYQCRHIFTDGHRCGSPCLRGEDLCYYHHTTRRPAQNLHTRTAHCSTFEIPLPEDRSAIQHTIGQVLQRIAANDIDPRRAGLLLYGLQIASLNLPRQQPARNSARETPETVEEIVTDPELGPLAPPAEVGHATHRKSPVAELLERMMRQSEEKPPASSQSTILPSLQAEQADPSTPPKPQSCHPRHRTTFSSMAVRCRCRGKLPAGSPWPDSPITRKKIAISQSAKLLHNHTVGVMSISVVIPAFNASKYIAETIESVLRQTLPPDEVLVVDDGSTDDTAAIASAFGPHVRVIRTPNSKLPATRNRGVREAKGEWIAFVDADDIWEDNKLARQMQELRRHPEADLCYTGRILLVELPDSTPLCDVIKVPPAATIGNEMLRANKFPPSCVVIRRSTFLAVGGHDTTFPFVEDWDLWLRLLKAGVKFVDCPEPLLQYRVHPDNMTHNAIPLLEGADRVYRAHIMPQFSGLTRWIRYFTFRGLIESSAALVLRTQGDPRHLSLMAASLCHRPFCDPHSYKIMAHMLYTRLTQSPKQVSAAQEFIKLR